MQIRLEMIIAIAATAFLAACGGGSAATNNFTPLPSTGTPTTGVGVSTGFYVKVSDTNFTTSLHKFGSYSSSCSIPTTTTTPTDLQCLLNIQEADLFFNDLNLEINLPAGMCKYYVEYPYWYWNRQPGIGPATLAATITGGTLADCTADGVAGTVATDGSRCSVQEGEFDATGAFKCLYDYSTLTGTNVGPNCCSGDYVKTVTTNGTPATTSGKYGGKVGNCAAGPGKIGTGWPVSSLNGLPMMKYTTVSQTLGMNATKTIPSVFSVAAVTGGDTYSANFFGWSTYAAGSTLTTDLPYALSANTDSSGSYTGVPNPAYVFACSDNGSEFKHMIRVYINEWDTAENFEAYNSSGGDTTHSPNVSCVALEGIGCAVGSSVTGLGYCDDFWDWDQYTTNGVLFPVDSFKAQ